MISTSKRCVKHTFAGQNTQQYSNNHYFGAVANRKFGAPDLALMPRPNQWMLLNPDYDAHRWVQILNKIQGKNCLEKVKVKGKSLD